MTNKVFTFVGNELSPLELFKKLKADRGLSDVDIDRLGITIVASSSTKDELGWAEPNPLFKIPYWGITGEKLADNRGNQLARYRRTVLNAKGERYTQRAGTGSRHYLPLGQDWVNVAKDPDIGVFYTEGEFKAIAACKFLGPCIGNSGVSSWRGPNGLAPPLDEFVWKGRTVTVVYDAEATSTKAVPLKSNIVKALGEFAVELKIRGATVRQLLIAKTPHFVEGEKMGVDDYFLSNVDVSPEQLKADLLATSCEPVVDEDLMRLFEKYAIFIGTKPHIKDIQNGNAYTAKEFELFIEPKTRIVDRKPVKLANIYREHPDRNEFDAYVFDPSQDPGYREDTRVFNTWPGFLIQPERSVNYDTHIGQYLEFQRGVWGDTYVDFFLDWASHLFQRPWELTTISPILVSRVKGVGKSLTFGMLRDLIGSKGSFIGSVDGLTEKHTGELEGKLFVQVDEADALFAGKENRLKALDADEIRIRKMNTDGYTIRNIMRKAYSTNENAAFRISADERRYYVVRVDKTEEDGEEGAAWNTWLRSDIVPMRRNPQALGDLMEFFMARDISSWDPAAPVPRTEAMMDMVDAGESKKSTMANELFNSLSELSVWVTDSAITAVDKKMWGDVRAILKDKGGRSVQHVIKTEGAPKSVSVWMTRGHIREIMEDPKRGAKLANGQMTADEARSLLLKTRARMETVMRLVDSSKF